MNENSKRDVWFYEELGRFLMTYGWKVTNVNELRTFSKVSQSPLSRKSSTNEMDFADGSTGEVRLEEDVDRRKIT